MEIGVKLGELWDFNSTLSLILVFFEAELETLSSVGRVKPVLDNICSPKSLQRVLMEVITHSQFVLTLV